MTVSTEVNHNEYTGNGVTTSFPYTFRIFKASDLVVTTSDTNGVLRTLMLNTDYTVTGVGSYSGGAVVLPLPLANGWAISIERSLPVVQETDLRNQGKFFAETHEGAFDYLTMLIQQCFGWLRLALLKPSFIARYYDAKQNRIANLSDPGAAQDAVNNRSMRNYVDAAIAGVVGGFGWFIQYGAGAVYRTFQDKMRDAVSPKDFNIKGDGSTNDTAAFSVLETTFSNLDIDLQGKTYFVDAIPSGNRYYNGQWLLPSGPARGRWQGAQLTGGGRIAFGDGALESLPIGYETGENGVVLAMGYKALSKATQVKQAIAIGPNAMENSLIARDSVAIGVSTLKNLQARDPNYSQTQLQGTRMVALGGNAGYFAKDTYNMVIIGRNAGHCVEGGFGLVAVGAAANSGYAVVGLSGEIENNAPWGVDGENIRTVAVGFAAAGTNLSTSTVAIGGEALRSNKRSTNNTGVGVRALYSLDVDTGYTGGANVDKDIAGTYSHSGNVLTLNFTAHGAVVGDKVQIRLLDGGSQTFLGDQPIATVTAVLSANSFTVYHPISHTASGNAHLYGLETAAQQPRNEFNTALGASSGTNMKTGAFNTLLGCQAAQTATTITRATLIGYQAGGVATSVTNSALVGTFCATNMTTITNVTAIGDSSLRFKVDGTNLTEAWSNIAGIGSNTRISGQNQMQLGDTNINVYAQSAIQIRSDERDKADKREIDGDLAVAFVRGLKSYLYKYDFRDDYFEEHTVQVGIDENAQPVFETKLRPIPKDGSKKRERDHAGYLAQQIKALMDELGIDFGMYQDHLVNGGCDVKTLAYEQAIPFITKALDMAFSRLDEIEERLAKLESQ